MLCWTATWSLCPTITATKGQVFTGFGGCFPRTWTLTAVVSKLPKSDGCSVSPVYMETLYVKKVALNMSKWATFQVLHSLRFWPKLGHFLPLLSVLCPWDGKKVLKEKEPSWKWSIFMLLLFMVPKIVMTEIFLVAILQKLSRYSSRCCTYMVLSALGVVISWLVAETKELV